MLTWQTLPHACSHKEADTHLLLRAVDAVQKGHRKLLICTVDTDVVVLAIAKFSPEGIKFWYKVYIPIHEIVSGMDPSSSASFPRTHWM